MHRIDDGRSPLDARGRAALRPIAAAIVAAAAMAFGCDRSADRSTDRSAEEPGTSAGFETLDDFVASYWIRPIPQQGRPPGDWPEIEASLRPEACGTCHEQKIEDWSTTIHSKAYSPGLAGQLVNWERTSASTVRDCLACHAPLAEQIAWTGAADGSVSPNPDFDRGLRDHGITCSACHVRAGKRYGPLPRDGSPSKSPAGAPHGGVTRTEYFSDSRFCAGCHQFEAPAPEGKSIQNTYEEWKSSDWAAEGVSCQDCHMPDRRHLWRGIHDPEMTASALTISWVGGAEAVGLTIRNSGAGHHFPTYVTPEVLVEIALLDRDGEPLPNGSSSWLIARKVEYREGTWVETSDSRIAAGEEVMYLVNAPADQEEPAYARAKITVRPDAVYREVFAGFLVGALSDTSRALLTDAMVQAAESPFVIFEERIPLAP